MKIWKQSIKIGMCILIVGCLLGCGAKEKEDTSDVEKEKLEEQEIEEEVRVFVDDAGREVVLPDEITSVVPTGPISQIYLYTACPDLLTGIATEFSQDAQKYIDRKYFKLPELGQLYGSNGDINLEELLNNNPDVIIDMGELKKSTIEDLNLLQEQVGIPVIFIEISMYTMEKGYSRLGELLEMEELNELGTYAGNIVNQAQSITEQYEGQQKQVYLALGNEGLNTNARGSFHAQLLDLLGIQNVADIEAVGAGAGSEVSLEQVIMWNPEIILTYTDEVYETITTDEKWGDIQAVQEGNVYKVPTEPYNFISDPPAVNRIIGVNWLGNLVYPELYSFLEEDMVAFYSMFYHIDLEENEVAREDILRYAR